MRSKAQKRWTARSRRTYAYRDLALMVVGMMVGGRIGARRALVESMVAGAFKAKVRGGRICDDPKNPKMRALGLANLGWDAMTVYRRDGRGSRARRASPMPGAGTGAAGHREDQQMKPQRRRQRAARDARRARAVCGAREVRAGVWGQDGRDRALRWAGRSGRPRRIFRGEQGEAAGDNVPTKVAVGMGAVGYAASEDEAHRIRA